MAIEKMKIMGVIGKKELLDRVMRLIVLSGSMHFLNAFSRISASDFVLPPNEKNIEALEELPFVKPYNVKRDFSRDEEMVVSLLGLFNISPEIKPEYLSQDYDYEEYIKNISDIYLKIREYADEIKGKSRIIEEKEEYIQNLKYLEKFDFDLSRLLNMKFMTFKLLKLTKENYLKLKKNYENIPAVVIKVEAESKYVYVASITPNTLQETVERILSSLNFEELKLPAEYEGNASTIIRKLSEEIEEDNNKIEQLKKQIEGFGRQFKEDIKKSFSRLEMEKKIEELKSDVAISKSLFYLFGFVPVSRVESLKDGLEKNFKDELIILIEDADNKNSSLTPPTKLKNLGLFRPFEEMVKMYGIPSYDEKDPTVFFGITYMLLFGAMFGDLGQGLILFSAGVVLNHLMKRPNLGGVLSRIGLSSAFFGLLYGSVFGSEELIPALIVRPMANINFMLLSAVVLGICLLIAGFVFGILNSSLSGNFKEGVFGRNGAAGLSFYILLLYTIYNYAVKDVGLSPWITFVLILTLMVIVFREPLSNILLRKEKLFTEPVGDYFVEEGFGVLETLLSMVSNTISFIRVGAFALNHVGLYIAFATMAEMTRSKVGGIMLLILGNTIIIGLEGLIVFIQALRLEYYELFSKYFKGEGIEYSPAVVVKSSDYIRKIRSLSRKTFMDQFGRTLKMKMIKMALI
ncbi:MAG: V-type ATP synthase subunit I [Thermovenabulum sp.]|uniref:V-type ATP synthase subunit I n=1 Tax=Thermovenabulum sp. TaxID=3100335 RepID=UPI003C7D3522